LTTRLGLRGETQQLMRGLALLHRHSHELDQPNLAPSRVVELLENIDPVALALAPVIYAGQAQLLDYLHHYQEKWQKIHAELDGNDLHELGVPRGPLYGEILRALRAAKLDGILHTRGDELAYVQSRLQQP
jgi:tRNA nucleotidyltransferase (CCA-adding enzyme)